MNLRLTCGILLLLRAVFPAPAAERMATEPLKVTVDYARFRGDESRLLVEFYYSIPRAGLTYVADTAGWRAEATLTIQVRSGDSTVHADRWLVPHVVYDTSSGPRGVNLVGLYPVMLGPGKYVCTMYAQDRNSVDRRDSVTFDVPITPLPATHLVVSDLELATSIRQGGEGSQFFKNTLEVVPNVEGVFAESQSCWIYAEVYNVLATEDRSDYTVRTAVLDAVGHEVVSREKPRRRTAESAVLVDNLAMQNLRTGTYSVLVTLRDSASRVVSSSGKRFFVYNRALGVDTSLVKGAARIAGTEFARMDEAQLDAEFARARYLAADNEKAQYPSLRGEEAKREFLLAFWSRRPPGARTTLLERARFADQYFHTVRRAGYLADRGRVYIIYGPPDDIDRHPSEAETRPFEIWSYNSLQGGVIFAFVLKQIGGEYELVHSTYRDEVRDDNWMRFVQVR
jgi:GWxTD domain-containing protein